MTEPESAPPGVETRRANVARVYDYWLILHFIADDEDPWRIVATLRDALAPGSYLVLSHGTNEDRPDVASAVEKVYNRGVATALHVRSRRDILRFFDGFPVVDPGLVYIPRWRPDPGDDLPANPSRYGNLVGVGREAADVRGR